MQVYCSNVRNLYNLLFPWLIIKLVVNDRTEFECESSPILCTWIVMGYMNLSPISSLWQFSVLMNVEKANGE